LAPAANLVFAPRALRIGGRGASTVVAGTAASHPRMEERLIADSGRNLF